MSYFIECPYCHAHLDPGETCDCRAAEPLDEPSDEETPEDSIIPEDEYTKTVSTTTDDIKELERLAAPLVEWIRTTYGYHTDVVITADYVCVKHDGIGIPYPITEK